MGHRYQKGASRPDGHNRDKGRRPERRLLDGIPWPALGDGTPWTDQVKRVRHHDLTEEAGKLQWIEWSHPDGTHMPTDKRTKTTTVNKAQREVTAPGAWYAVVAWDSRDTYDFGLLARHPLVHLLPE